MKYNNPHQETMANPDKFNSTIPPYSSKKKTVSICNSIKHKLTCVSIIPWTTHSIFFAKLTCTITQEIYVLLFTQSNTVNQKNHREVFSTLTSIYFAIFIFIFTGTLITKSEEWKERSENLKLKSSKLWN